MAKSIRDSFLEFHKANPKVYELFERFTNEAIDSGMTHIGSKFVFERIRWETSVVTKGAGYCAALHRPLKLSNNFTPWYAGLFMAKNRKHVGIFACRGVKS